MGEKMSALFEKGCTNSFRRKTYKLFSDIDALAVSMSQKFLCRLRSNQTFIFKESRVYSPSRKRGVSFETITHTAEGDDHIAVSAEAFAKKLDVGVEGALVAVIIVPPDGGYQLVSA